MSKLVVHGVPPSSYVRTVRMAIVEKGQPHDLAPIADFGGKAHLAVHPFGKVPSLTHGDVQLYETTAILRYLDATFDGGTRLVPSSPSAAAKAEQVASAFNAYMYDDMIRGYALKYIFPGDDGPDRAAIEAALPNVERDLDVVAGALGDAKWLSGDSFGFADLLLAPALGTAAFFPEAKALVEARPAIGAWLGAVGDRPSAEYLYPPQP